MWSKPEATLFGWRHSTNGGWTFRYSAATNAFVGSVGLSQDANSGPQPMSTSTVTVALDATTGAVRWSKEGADTFCDVQTTPDESVDADPLLACQWRSGTIAIDKRANSVSFDKPAMDFSSLDVTTGAERWIVPVGEVSLDRSRLRPMPALVPKGVIVDRVPGAVRIALADGATALPDPDVVAWRQTPIEFTQKVPWISPSGPAVLTRNGEVLEGFRQGQVTSSVTVPIPDNVGERFDGALCVLTTKAGVAAYRE